MRKERKIINTNIRLNLCDEQDRQAWEYLQTMDREKYKSYTRAVVVALNDYFSREYRNEADPYLETREKEDAFLERVETAVRDGVKESAPMAIAKNLMEMLVPFVKESVGESKLSDRILTMEKKKAVGEDTLIYEKKGQDAIHFHSYAKLLFSTNEMPQNLEDKSDAFYRRLLILDMNRVVKSGEKDLHLKEKVQAESDYAIHMAMIALKNLYEQGKFTESEHSKECVREVQRTSDSICAFIDESLVRAKGKRLKRSEVFHMYEEYCKENGRQGHGKSNFFRNMTDKGFLLKQYNGEFYYQDIAVKEEDFCPVDPEERIPFEETVIDYKQLQLNMNQGIKGI